MLIDCPSCARAYQVSNSDIGRGRTVVCPRCETRWFQIGEGGAQIEANAVSTRFAPQLDEMPDARRRPAVPRSVGLALCAVLAGLALAAPLARRDSVVRAMPRTAALYAALGRPVNVVGLVLAHVAPERLASDDVTVRGSLRNVAGRRVVVPRLSFEVRDEDGTALVRWSEAVTPRTLAADRTVDFVSTPHRLPAESRTVLVRFD